MENWLISKPSMIYTCKVKVCDLFTTYYFKTMKLLSYSWKPIVYYNFWKLLLSCQITHFSPLVSDCEEYQFLGVLTLCCEQEKKFSDFGIGWSSNSFIFIDQLALCTWGLDFVPLNYWRSIHKEIIEVFWIYLILTFEDKF